MALGFMDGNEAIARSAFASGCRFFAGYPITPASSISDWMRKLLPPAGGIYLQCEDEIAAMGTCLGAAMAGQKVMTATSGPGISLFSEQISFAIGSEIPIVIVNVQRLGPSTGSPTRGADGDIQFMRWASSGGMPVIILSPCDVIDCYELTHHAFNLSEQYRCPVFIASNKEVGTTQESVDLAALRLPVIQTRRLAAIDRPYLPFAIRSGETVPDFLPIGGETPVRQTSSTHGPEGYITVDPVEISENRNRLKNKIDAVSETIAMADFTLAPGARTLLVTYGITARAAQAAVAEMARTDHPASLLVIKTLYPVPHRLILDKAAAVDRVVVAEMNLGQYVREIQRVLPNKRVYLLGQMDGELITPGQIQEVLTDAHPAE